jgi:hypothetical protein
MCIQCIAHLVYSRWSPASPPRSPHPPASRRYAFLQPLSRTSSSFCVGSSPVSPRTPQVHIHAYTHAYTCIHAYTHAYTCIHAYTYTYTYTHRQRRSAQAQLHHRKQRHRGRHRAGPAPDVDDPPRSRCVCVCVCLCVQRSCWYVFIHTLHECIHAYIQT